MSNFETMLRCDSVIKNRLDMQSYFLSHGKVHECKTMVEEQKLFTSRLASLRHNQRSSSATTNQFWCLLCSENVSRGLQKVKYHYKYQWYNESYLWCVPITCNRFGGHVDMCRRNLAGAGREIDGSCFDSCRYVAHNELHSNNNEQA